MPSPAGRLNPSAFPLLAFGFIRALLGPEQNSCSQVGFYSDSKVNTNQKLDCAQVTFDLLARMHVCRGVRLRVCLVKGR